MQDATLKSCERLNLKFMVSIFNGLGFHWPIPVASDFAKAVLLTSHDCFPIAGGREGFAEARSTQLLDERDNATCIRKLKHAANRKTPTLVLPLHQAIQQMSIKNHQATHHRITGRGSIPSSWKCSKSLC